LVSEDEPTTRRSTKCPRSLCAGYTRARPHTRITKKRKWWKSRPDRPFNARSPQISSFVDSIHHMGYEISPKGREREKRKTGSRRSSSIERNTKKEKQGKQKTTSMDHHIHTVLYNTTQSGSIKPSGTGIAFRCH